MPRYLLAIASLMLFTVGCGGSAQQATLDQLNKCNEDYRAFAERMAGRPPVAQDAQGKAGPDILEKAGPDIYAAAVEKAGFEIHSVENIGIHYSITIDRWYDNWMRNRDKVVEMYGEYWFRLWQVFLGWSVHIAKQGNSTCFQIVCNKNLEDYNRYNFVGERGLGSRASKGKVAAGNGVPIEA